MDIKGLGYIRIDATDLDAWRTFATDVLGLAVAQGSGPDALLLKMDERPFRFAILPSDTDGIRAAGWEVANARELDDAAKDLDAAGVTVEHGSAEEAAERRVRGFLSFRDPGGARLELFHGPVQDHAVFASPVGVSRFNTGHLGMGHMVMLTPTFDETLRFYLDVLGFRESDWMRMGPTQLCFLHCNRRHHSIALAGADRSAINHFMIEAGTIDDVGQAFDRFLAAGIRIHEGLGRHSNDKMFSFYAQTPGGFNVEFGYGGIEVDDATWTTQEITKTSDWGHHRPPRPPAA